MKKLKIKLLNDEDKVEVKYLYSSYPIVNDNSLVMYRSPTKRSSKLEYTTYKPTRATEGSSGFDIYSPVDFSLDHGDTILLPLRFSTEIPKGYCAMVMPRSGVGTGYKARLCNTIGLIDSDYRGPIGLIMINMGEFDFKITHGMRIAQIVFAATLKVQFKVSKNLSQTIRSNSGFGSTGTK